MNRYHPIANPDRDLTINGTTIRHIYDADRIWVHNADLADAIGALAKGSLLTGVSAKWKRKWREDLGGGKATRAATYLVAEGLLQRSMSMKRDSDSYPRLREAIDQIRTIEAERRTQHAEALTTALHENELFKNRANIHIPCPIDCGVTLHDALTSDQIKDWDKLQVSGEAVEHCITRLAEHLMRHRRSQVSQLL